MKNSNHLARNVAKCGLTEIQKEVLQQHCLTACMMQAVGPCHNTFAPFAPDLRHLFWRKSTLTLDVLSQCWTLKSESDLQLGRVVFLPPSFRSLHKGYSSLFPSTPDSLSGKQRAMGNFGLWLISSKVRYLKWLKMNCILQEPLLPVGYLGCPK